MTLIWIFVFTVFFCKNEAVIGSKQCGKDHYTINKTGSISCLLCNSCPEGQGLSPPCGSVLIHPPGGIECFPCKPGETYSTNHGPSSCKKCHHCSVHEIVIKNCTEYSDTICSGKCYPGFYFENHTHGCVHCSHCCGDGNDIKIPACKSMGLRQCSFINSQKCTPPPPLTTKPTTASVTIVTTTAKKEGSKQWSSDKIVASAIGGIFGAVIIIILICWYYRRHKHKKRKQIHKNNHAGNGDIENGGVPLIPQCGLSKVPFDLRIQNVNQPETHIKQVPEESQLLLEIFCENEKDDCFKKCRLNFIWRKDGNENIGFEDRKLFKVDHLKVSDSGEYKCRVHCAKHNQHRDCKIVIHVQPKPGHAYKRLQKLSPVQRDKIESMLITKIPGVGDWRSVGDHYGMESYILNSLENDSERAKKVIDSILSRNPTLTVFEFCKFLKTKNQMSIVTELDNDLTVEQMAEKRVDEERNETSLNDTRDSGIDFDDPCSLKVNLPDSTNVSETANQDIPAISVELSPDQFNLQAKLPESTISDNGDQDLASTLVEHSPESKLETVPHHMMRGRNVNPSYSDSSREGSLDDLNLLPRFKYLPKSNSDSSQGGKKKRKWSFNRQVSKDSQKSAGNVSLKSVKNAVKDKLTKPKNDKYWEQEDTDDSEV